MLSVVCDCCCGCWCFLLFLVVAVVGNGCCSSRCLLLVVGGVLMSPGCWLLLGSCKHAVEPNQFARDSSLQQKAWNFWASLTSLQLIDLSNLRKQHESATKIISDHIAPSSIFPVNSTLPNTIGPPWTSCTHLDRNM